MERGRAATSQDSLYLLWNSKHGGTYVYGDGFKSSGASDYQEFPKLVTNTNKELYEIDHAQMMKEAYSLEGRKSQLSSRLVSPTPLNEKNLPNDREKRAFATFGIGNGEYCEVYTYDGQKWFFFMQELIMSESCMKCHGSNDAKIGSIRGGIGYRMSMSSIDPFYQLRESSLKFAHFWIWILGMLLLWVSSDWALRKLKEIRKYQFELASQNRFVHDVIDALPYPFVVVDANSTRVVMANKAVKASGSAEEQRCTDFDLVDWKAGEEGIEPCPVKMVKEKKLPVVVEIESTRDDGSIAFTEVHGYPLFDDKGDVTRVIEYYIDATERKKADEALRLIEKQPAQLAAVHAAAVTYAHEINNPLTGIIGYAEMLQEPAVDPKTRLEMVKGILESAERIAAVIAKMQEISRLNYVGYSGGDDIIDIHDGAKA
jgi:PAS domain-containing protein